MPTIATVVDLGEAGGLMSYGPDVADNQAQRRTARGPQSVDVAVCRIALNTGSAEWGGS
jgi:hypothetical protein